MHSLKDIKLNLIKSCSNCDATIFEPYLFDSKVETDYPTKDIFYTIFNLILNTAKSSSKGILILRVENQSEEKNKKMCYYNFYDRHYIEPRLTIIIEEIEDCIKIDILPF